MSYYPVIAPKTTPLEYDTCLRAAYHEHSSTSITAQFPNLNVVDEKKIHGYKMLCIKNISTNEIFVVMHGTKVKRFGHHIHNVRNALHLTNQGIIKRVNSAVAEWQTKFGLIDFAAPHSAAAVYMAELPKNILKIFWKPHTPDGLPDHNSIALSTEGDWLRKFNKVFHSDESEIIGKGGHGVDDVPIDAETKWEDLSPRFYTPVEFRPSMLQDPKLQNLEAEIRQKQKDLQKLLNQFKDEPERSQKKLLKEIRALNTDIKNKDNEYHRTELQIKEQRRRAQIKRRRTASKQPMHRNVRHLFGKSIDRRGRMECERNIERTVLLAKNVLTEEEYYQDFQIEELSSEEPSATAEMNQRSKAHTKLRCFAKLSKHIKPKTGGRLIVTSTSGPEEIEDPIEELSSDVPSAEGAESEVEEMERPSTWAVALSAGIYGVAESAATQLIEARRTGRSTSWSRISKNAAADGARAGAFAGGVQFVENTCALDPGVTQTVIRGWTIFHKLYQIGHTFLGSSEDRPMAIRSEQILAEKGLRPEIGSVKMTKKYHIIQETKPLEASIAQKWEKEYRSKRCPGISCTIL